MKIGWFLKERGNYDKTDRIMTGKEFKEKVKSSQLFDALGMIHRFTRARRSDGTVMCRPHGCEDEFTEMEYYNIFGDYFWKRGFSLKKLLHNDPAEHERLSEASRAEVRKNGGIDIWGIMQEFMAVRNRGGLVRLMYGDRFDGIRDVRLRYTKFFAAARDDGRLLQLKGLMRQMR